MIASFFYLVGYKFWDIQKYYINCGEKVLLAYANGLYFRTLGNNYFLIYKTDSL